VLLLLVHHRHAAQHLYSQRALLRKHSQQAQLLFGCNQCGARSVYQVRGRLASAIPASGVIANDGVSNASSAALASFRGRNKGFANAQWFARAERENPVTANTPLAGASLLCIAHLLLQQQETHRQCLLKQINLVILLSLPLSLAILRWVQHASFADNHCSVLLLCMFSNLLCCSAHTGFPAALKSSHTRVAS
jgi:hypothetical protein